MKQQLKELWHATTTFRRDESGSVGWIGLILLTSIVSLGMIVGLTTYRSHVLQQFGDAAVAMRNLRQTYRYEVRIDVDGNGAFDDSGDYLLECDFDDAVDLFDTPTNAPACMNLLTAPENES